MMEKKLNIKLRDWEYTCGDGCCYEWGVSCKVNNEETDTILFSNSNDIANGLQVVLEHLGYEVNIDFNEEA